MEPETIQRIVLQALGKASAVFMSQEVKGTEIVMPSEELAVIAEDTTREIISAMKTP